MFVMKLSELQKRAGSFILKGDWTLRQRILFQKSIYLLQEMGALKTKYSFAWYIFGPYSSAVAKIGYEYIENRVDEQLVVSNDVEKIIKKFDAILQKCPSSISTWNACRNSPNMWRFRSAR